MADCRRGHKDPERTPTGDCKPCRADRTRQWKVDNREKHLARTKIANAKKRDKEREGVLDAYGRQCACCGEDREVFLVIDHIDGGGNEHRRSIGSTRNKKNGGSRTYEWLRRRGYPPGYQTLCANCNTAKERPGGCPHQKEKETPEHG